MASSGTSLCMNNRDFGIPNMPTVGFVATGGNTVGLPVDILQWYPLSLSSGCICKSPADGMDFNGTWKVYSDENLEAFLQAMSVPEMMIKMAKDVKPVTTIKQQGLSDFSIEVKTPMRTIVNTFRLGKETEITALGGQKFKCTVREENGKLVCETEKFTSVRELQGEDMVETVTAGTACLVRKSKRVR